MPTVQIITPTPLAAADSKRHAARRWARFLQPHYHVRIASAWSGMAADVMIAFDALVGGEAAEAYSAAYPGRPVLLVPSAMDIYRRIHRDRAAIAAVETAHGIIVTQPRAMFELAPHLRAKTRVIFPSASRQPRLKPHTDCFEVLAVAPLTAAKDPYTLIDACQRLPADSRVHIVHVGPAPEPDFETACETGLERLARSARSRHYEWIGELSHDACRELMRRARATLITSRIEDGSHVIAESVMSDVRVIASRIPGNLGMLDDDYAGLFRPGDSDELADLLARIEHDRHLRTQLKLQCQARSALFEPERERAALVELVAQTLQASRERGIEPMHPEISHLRSVP